MRARHDHDRRPPRRPRLALALVAPLLSHDLTRAGHDALLGGTRVVLDGDAPLRQKVPIALDLRNALASAPNGVVPDLAEPFDSRGAAHDAGLRQRSRRPRRRDPRRRHAQLPARVPALGAVRAAGARPDPPRPAPGRRRCDARAAGRCSRALGARRGDAARRRARARRRSPRRGAARRPLHLEAGVRRRRPRRRRAAVRALGPRRRRLQPRHLARGARALVLPVGRRRVGALGPGDDRPGAARRPRPRLARHRRRRPHGRRARLRPARDRREPGRLVPGHLTPAGRRHGTLKRTSRPGDRPLGELDHLVGELDQRRVVGRADDGEAALVCGAGEEGADGAGVLLVEAGGRLVDEEERRVGRERAGDRDPLALAGREVGDAGRRSARRARPRRAPPRAAGVRSPARRAAASRAGRSRARSGTGSAPAPASRARSRGGAARRAAPRPSSPRRSPATTTEPSLGCSRPASMCSSVVLPLPDRPTSAGEDSRPEAPARRRRTRRGRPSALPTPSSSARDLARRDPFASARRGRRLGELVADGRDHDPAALDAGVGEPRRDRARARAAGAPSPSARSRARGVAPGRASSTIRPSRM